MNYKIVCKTILNNIDIDKLYESSQFNCHHHAEKTLGPLTHKEQFAFAIIQEYMRLKSTNIGRRITDEDWAESMKRRRARRMKIVKGS